MAQSSALIKATDAIQSDLRAVCNEVKKKYPHIKDEIETALLKIRNVTTREGNMLQGLTDCSPDIVKPLIGACASVRQAKIAQIALGVFQKQIALEVLNEDAAIQMINALYMLSDSQCEEVRVLQTITLLVTTNRLVVGEMLAKSLVLCLRLVTSANAGVSSTANAVFRQLVNAVFDRVVQMSYDCPSERSSTAAAPAVTKPDEKQPTCEITVDQTEAGSLSFPIVRSLYVRDACALVTDICLLENGDLPRWLLGVDVDSFSKLFGLDVLEQLLAGYRRLFVEIGDMKQLVRDHVCLLLVRLLSAVLKSAGNVESLPTTLASAPASAPAASTTKSSTQKAGQNATNDTSGTQSAAGSWYVAPFPSVNRLFRVLRILMLGGYFDLIVTECEIFVTMLIRLLETYNRAPTGGDTRPVASWQRTLALELTDALFVESNLVAAVGASYEHLLSQLVNAIAATAQQLAMTDANGLMNATEVPFVPVTNNASTLDRSTLLELQNGTDSQVTQLATRQYSLTVVYSCLINLTRALRKVVEPELNGTQGQVQAACKLLKLTHEGVLTGLEAVVQCSSDERCSAMLLDALNGYASLLARAIRSSNATGNSSVNVGETSGQRPAGAVVSLFAELEACLFAFCTHSLPINYATLVLSHTLQHSENTDRLRSLRPKAESHLAPGNQTTIAGGGTPLATLHVPQPQHFVSNVALTGKHLQSFQALISVLHSVWQVLDSASWYMVFSCLQHVEWVCGMRIDKLRCAVPSDKDKDKDKDTHSISSSNSVADVSQVPGSGSDSAGASLVSQISRILQQVHGVYAATQQFDLQRLKQLLSAVVRLSSETAELCTMSAREPNLFSLQLLWDISVHNLTRQRLAFVWPLLSTHLVQLIQHANATLRVNVADCLVGLVRESLMRIRKAQQSHKSNSADVEYVLDALRSLSAMSCCLNQTEIRLRQFDCVQYLLRHCCDMPNDSENENDNEDGSEQDVLRSVSSPENGDADEDEQRTAAAVSAAVTPSTNNSVWNTEGWLILLGVIGTVNDANSEQIIRKGFSCLQLIANEYLAGLPPQCFSVLIDITSKYTQQLTDLNIALTAIGALWHVADHFQQNATHLRSLLQAAGALSDLTSVQLGASLEGDASEDGGHMAELNAYDLIVLRLYSRLARACFDFRSTIRKSAIQTLFLALQLHTSTSGSHWDTPGWCVLLYRILFPTLRNVISQFFKVTNADASDLSPADLAALEQAEREAIGAGSSFLAHHSRATAEQKWSETVILALSSVASFVNRNLESIVLQLHDAPAGQSHINAWCSLLEMMQMVALATNPEVAYQALKSFAELVLPASQVPSTAPFASTNKSAAAIPAAESREQSLLIEHCNYRLQVLAFETWLKIGRTALCIGASQPSKPASSLPNQQFLILLVRLFTELLVQLNAPQPEMQPNVALRQRSSSVSSAKQQQSNDNELDGLRNEMNLAESFAILYLSLLVPIQPNENVLYLLPDSDESHHDVMTPLQRQVLDTFEMMSRWSVESAPGVPSALTSNLHIVLENLLFAIEFACRSPVLTSMAQKYNVSVIYQQTFTSRGASPLDPVPDRPTSGSDNAGSIISRVHSVGFIVFGEKCLKMCINLYRAVHSRPIIVEHKILERFLWALHLPLSLKFACTSHTTWILASRAFDEVIEVGLTTALRSENVDRSTTLWPAILSCVDDFLFGKQNVPLTLSIDEFHEFESVDCEFLKVIRREFLSVGETHSSAPEVRKSSSEKKNIQVESNGVPKLLPVPSDFLAKLLAILNKGALSVSDPSAPSNDAEMNEQAAFVNHFDSQMLLSGIRVRSHFDLLCFETLLEYALTTPTTNVGLRWNAQVLEGLLEKAKRVLSSFLHDQRLVGPHGSLPRVRHFELTQTLRSLLCVFAAVRKVESGLENTTNHTECLSINGNSGRAAALSPASHKLLIEIYPLLVDCTVIQQLFIVPAFSPLPSGNSPAHASSNAQSGENSQKRNLPTDASPAGAPTTVAQSVHDVLMQYAYLLNPIRNESSA